MPNIEHAACGTQALPLVPIIAGQTLRAWPGHEEGGEVDYLPLGEALRRNYFFDAHTAQYSVPHVRRRLDSRALEELGEIPMVWVLFDVDAKEAHKATGGDGSVEASQEWWEAEKEKLGAFLDAHPGGFVYRTRGGYRIVYILPTPFVLRAPDGAGAWSAQYLAWCAYLWRRFGVVADPVHDWTRLLRLPHATREPHPDPGGGR